MFKASSARIFRGYSAAVLACRTDPNDRFTHLPKSWRGVLTVPSFVFGRDVCWRGAAVV